MNPSTGEPQDELVVEILDALVAIRSGSAATAAYLRTLWSRCLASTTRRAPVRKVTLPGTAEVPSRELLLRLTSELTLVGIEHAAGAALMFHAAGVALPDGRVIALVGESGAGKTTAAHHLCRMDGPTRYGYVTDETVAVNRDLRVRPFAKPLALCQADDTTKSQRGPDELGLAVAPGALTLAAVVLLHRDRHHPGAARATRMLAIDVMEALVPHTSALTRMPDPVRRLAELAAACPGYAVSYREAEQLGPLLASLDVARPPDGESSGAGPAPDEPRRGGSEQVEVDETDVLTGPDGGFLLAGGRPVRLSPVGVTLWHGMRLGLTEDRLTDYVVERHGSHPQAQAIIERTWVMLSSLRAASTPPSGAPAAAEHDEQETEPDQTAAQPEQGSGVGPSGR